jgi:hypothetical protein
MNKNKCPGPERCQLPSDVDHMHDRIAGTRVEVAQQLIGLRAALDRFSDKLDELIREIRIDRKSSAGRFSKSEVPTSKDRKTILPPTTPKPPPLPPVRKKEP